MHHIDQYSACELIEALSRKVNKGKFGDCDGCETCNPEEEE